MPKQEAAVIAIQVRMGTGEVASIGLKQFESFHGLTRMYNVSKSWQDAFTENFGASPDAQRFTVRRNSPGAPKHDLRRPIHELINEFKYVRDCFTVVVTENARRESGAEANNGLAGTWRQQTLEKERRETTNGLNTAARPSKAPKLVKQIQPDSPTPKGRGRGRPPKNQPNLKGKAVAASPSKMGTRSTKRAQRVETVTAVTKIASQKRPGPAKAPVVHEPRQNTSHSFALGAAQPKVAPRPNEGRKRKAIDPVLPYVPAKVINLQTVVQGLNSRLSPNVNDDNFDTCSQSSQDDLAEMGIEYADVQGNFRERAKHFSNTHLLEIIHELTTWKGSSRWVKWTRLFPSASNMVRELLEI